MNRTPDDVWVCDDCAQDEYEAEHGCGNPLFFEMVRWGLVLIGAVQLIILVLVVVK